MMAAPQTDLFAVLGLPRRYAVEAGELERRFHERARALHPDRFARATPAERRASLERATRLNEAYRTLRDPWSRGEHLLALLDGGAPAPPLEAEFLEQVLEIREALGDAHARHDHAVVDALAARTRAALSALEGELRGWLAGEQPAPEARAAAGRTLARARYHRSLLAEAEAARDARTARSPAGRG